MAKPVKARVLVNVVIAGILYESGKHVVELDGDLAKQYVKDGALDTSTEAVKYALSAEGGAKLIAHAAPKPEPIDAVANEIASLEAALALASTVDEADALKAQIDAKRGELKV